MDEVDVCGGLEVDVVDSLDALEYLAVVGGDVGDVGVGESGTASADVAPRGTAAVVDHHRVAARLGEVAEGTAARDTATGDKDADMLAADVVGLGVDEDLLGVGVVEVAEGHLVRQRGTGRGIAGELDAAGAEGLAGTEDAAFAAAGAHTHAGDVLQLVDRDDLAVAHGGQHLVETDVLAVADVLWRVESWLHWRSPTFG